MCARLCVRTHVGGKFGVRTCVCVCACAFVFVCTHFDVSNRGCVFVSTHLCGSTFVCVFKWVCAHLSMYINVCMCVSVCAFLCVNL